jgi:hypothetical protein
LIQWNGGVRPETFRMLRERGITVTGYLPKSTLMIAVPDGFSFDSLPVVWVSRLDFRDKISPLVAAHAASSSGFNFFIVEFRSDVDMKEARALVREHGLRLIENSDLARSHLLVSGTSGDLSRLASWDEVAYIFPASPELIAHKPVRACAGAIVQETAVAQAAGNAYSWPSGSGGLVLGYVFSQLTEKLPPAATQSEILRAFNQWSNVAQVTFVSGTNAQALRTVNILFARGAHGDPFPFDGPGGVLAHTFYPAPPNPEPIAGDMHLDDDERWQIGADTDVYTVVLHEAGHSLGLVHTDNPDDVMYPYYRLGKRLSTGDIAIVQSLYGARTSTSTPPPTPAPAQPLLLTVQPPPATTTASSVAISGTVSGGTTPVQVAWNITGGAAGYAMGSPNWTATIPLVIGTNAVTITATDAAGHTAMQQVSVVRQQATPPPIPPGSTDKTPPSIVITYPAASVIATSATTISFRGTAMDNVGVTQVTWSNSTGASGLASGTLTWIATSIPLTFGTNTITFRAFDAAGNSSWRSATVVRQ